MKNKEIAEYFQRHAHLLTLAGENAFKIRAYDRVARALISLTKPIEGFAKQGTLTEIDGIGTNIAAHIDEYLKQGTIAEFSAMEKKFPPGLTEIMKVPGLGPRRPHSSLTHCTFRPLTN
jgi:DNA polymerase (family 10)